MHPVCTLLKSLTTRVSDMGWGLHKLIPQEYDEEINPRSLSGNKPISSCLVPIRWVWRPTCSTVNGISILQQTSATNGRLCIKTSARHFLGCAMQLFSSILGPQTCYLPGMAQNTKTPCGLTLSSSICHAATLGSNHGVSLRNARLSLPCALLRRAPSCSCVCTEVLKQFQMQEVHEFLRIHQHQPLLYSYSSDCASTRLHTTMRQTSSSSSVVRKGRIRLEFLMQRGILRALPGTSSEHMQFLFGEPRPMSLGKGQWFVFTGSLQPRSSSSFHGPWATQVLWFSTWWQTERNSMRLSDALDVDRLHTTIN